VAMAEGEAALPIGLNGFNLVLRKCCLLLSSQLGFPFFLSLYTPLACFCVCGCVCSVSWFSTLYLLPMALLIQRKATALYLTFFQFFFFFETKF
jgi:hypothetical protein